jgi:hypothetical protein
MPAHAGRKHEENMIQQRCDRMKYMRLAVGGEKWKEALTKAVSPTRHNVPEAAAVRTLNFT